MRINKNHWVEEKQRWYWELIIPLPIYRRTYDKIGRFSKWIRDRHLMILTDSDGNRHVHTDGCWRFIQTAKGWNRFCIILYPKMVYKHKEWQNANEHD